MIFWWNWSACVPGLQLQIITTSFIFLILFLQILQGNAWLPDTKSKLKLNDEHGIKFLANLSTSNYFTFLYQDDRFITIGSRYYYRLFISHFHIYFTIFFFFRRNTVYNLSLSDLSENRNQVIMYIPLIQVA